MTARIPLILGTANFGTAGKTGVRVSDIDEAQTIVNTFFKKYTELDSANIYGDGSSEELFGKLDLTGGTIDTKIHIWATPEGHLPEGLRTTLDVSLKALGLQKIRVYYLHMPDRRVPYEDTLREINKLHQEGKFEAFGLSNFPAWEVVEIIHICKANGWVKPTVYQGSYNAITRSIEAELIPAARKYGLRVVGYSPLAGGFLTGRIASPNTTLDRHDQFHPDQGWLGPAFRQRYLNDNQFKALDIIKQAAAKYNIPLIEVGYRWLEHHSALQPGDGIVFGTSDVEHLLKNIEYAEKGPLPAEVVDALDVAYKIVGSDSPSYFM